MANISSGTFVQQLQSFGFDPGKEWFVAMLRNAIQNKVETNFQDRLYGVPTDADITDDILTIYVSPSFIPPESSGYSMGKVNSFTVNISNYGKISPSNSAFNQNTQEFYFTNSETNDYFVIIFGC